MELLDTYINIEGYLINWELSIIVGSFMVYFIYWITSLTGFHKKANSFFEHYFRLILIVPFWLLLIVYTFDITVPNIALEYITPTIEKKVEIENNLDSKSEFSFFLKHKDSNNWRHINDGLGLFSMDMFYVEANANKEARILIDTSKYDSFLISYYPSNSDLQYGLKLRANDVPVKIFTKELQDEVLLDFEKDFETEIKKGVVFLLAIFFLWYHYGLLVRRVHRRIFMIVGLLFSLYCGFNVYLMLRVIFLKDFFGV
ncbi:hypothetical protein OAQ99_03695 [Candidatus Kapabacteria bacterium]|nr:hypothetical protein [Candidatus Kapabacteria bacterium]